MTKSVSEVRDDFDRIARLTAGQADGSGPYEAFLLRQVPVECTRILDIGCGTGGFSRSLAARGHHVTGIDVSPEMIRVARLRTSSSLRVTYRCSDFMRSSFDGEDFDAVVSIAMLHHVCVESAVPRMAALVRPGGVLIVHDLRSDAGVRDWPGSAMAVVARAWRLAREGRLRERAAVRAAWAEHGRDERYATIAEVRRWMRVYLPGAQVSRHLQWRYTVHWQKPLGR